MEGAVARESAPVYQGRFNARKGSGERPYSVPLSDEGVHGSVRGAQFLFGVYGH